MWSESQLFKGYFKPEWLSRDPEMTKDQNQARLLVGKALKEGVCQRQPGLPSMASPPARGNGPALCSCKMQESGGTQTLAEVVTVAFTLAKLFSHFHPEGPSEKLAWFGSTADMHSMTERINPQPSSFHSSSFSSACLPSVIV